MTREQREVPWQELSAKLADIPWPRNIQCKCGKVKSESSPHEAVKPEPD